jgi:hypothetical protein
MCGVTVVMGTEDKIPLDSQWTCDFFKDKTMKITVLKGALKAGGSIYWLPESQVQ